ncbi:MAG TPA: ketopantoate reductase family protein [Candidatus Methanoculleus thermohydrogenotrophicum]|nr:ketopantoate reductase family protein [Candidatus Methanoculleus thermohydrogenotrophicum]NLM82490.1 ketopantoate reductase family protein [Candidatus Methanoculleus thermohydrogenotrophicum]HOB18623.1 ketopantoate reductase family protein [Candidatus Methanoculleus thermohydrogenotrophicum]HPZ38722.1 ketopantoate reductase family protein [Candidatus Methanoculleus thermohydrogenotrophicum]HQC91895.1 ketopantoate reductase family protein [Candidatus Methanoculleus thermohydrogenotrophicum]
MKIVVLGAGAVGLTVAARLSRVVDIHAVARRRHADAVRERGLLMTGIWGEGTYRFSCSEDLPDAWLDADYYIITAKSTDTEAICRQFADAIRGREVVSLQNGIGNEEIIEQYTDRVIGGMAITGFEWRGDASVHVSVEAAPMKFGRFPSGMDDAVRRLVDQIQKAGIRAEATDEIRSDLWSKTLYNCALNPLGAVMNVPYGALTDPHAWAIVTEIVREAYQVVRAEGVALPWETADAYLEYLKTEQLPATAAHHSSMLQDLTLGRRTEIDFLNGAVANLARRYGIDAPYNTCITQLIRFRERL